MSSTNRKHQLIGRDKQIDRLILLADRVREKKIPVSVLIAGREGVGKTALMHYVVSILGKQDPTLLALRSPAQRGRAAPFFPMDQIVMEMLKLKPLALKKPAEEATETVRSRLEEMQIIEDKEELSQHARNLRSLLSTTVRSESDAEEEMTTPVEKYLYSIRRILSLLADKRSVVLMVDDMHTYSAESLGMVRALRTGLMGKPVLWVLVSEDATGEAKKLANETLELSPLSRDELGEFLKESFSDLDPFPEKLVDVLYPTSGGVPGVLQHHIGLLIEERILVLGPDGNWIFKPDRLVPENLPIDSKAIIELKLSQLDEGEREVLLLAAFIGEVFWDDALLALRRVGKAQDREDAAQIWPDDSEILGIQTVIDELCKKGFISSLESQEFYGVAEYTFAHEGLRQRLLTEADGAKNAAYQRAAARWLEMISRDKIGEYAEVIARKLERAGDRHASAHLYVKAAKVARGRYLFERAHYLFGKALENCDEGEAADALDSLHEMGNMAQALGKMDDALEHFTRMLHVSWKCVSRAKAAAALSKIGRIHRQQGDYSAARAFLERSLSLFNQAGDARGIASTKDDLGTINYLMGNYERARELYDRALHGRLQMNDERGVALSYEHIGQIERASGNYEEAEKHFRQALEIRRKIRDADGIISALNAMGIIAFERGGNEAAISIWKEALEHATRTSNLRMMEYLNNNIGEVFMGLGSYKIAETHFRQCMDIAMLVSDKRVEAEVCKNFGLLYTKTGNVKGAREYLNRSIATAKQIGAKEQMGHALQALGQLEGFSVFDETGGPAGAADSYFQEALDIFSDIGNESEFLRTIETYGQFLFDHGRVDEAISVMAKALDETPIRSEEIKKRLAETIRKMKRFAAS
ncbi:MAG: tetratricopeptide repeat protein [Pseudomonadota bacterium]